MENTKAKYNGNGEEDKKKPKKKKKYNERTKLDNNYKRKYFFSRVTGEFIASLTVDAVLKLCKSNSIFY